MTNYAENRESVWLFCRWQLTPRPEKVKLTFKVHNFLKFLTKYPAFRILLRLMKKMGSFVHIGFLLWHLHSKRTSLNTNVILAWYRERCHRYLVIYQLTLKFFTKIREQICHPWYPSNVISKRNWMLRVRAASLPGVPPRSYQARVVSREGCSCGFVFSIFCRTLWALVTLGYQEIRG